MLMLTTYLSHSIVFVHGLTGHRENTWTAHDATEPWPKTLLPTKLPNARILTFGYDASVADWRSVVSEARVGNHASNLLNALANFREEDDTVSLLALCAEIGADNSRLSGPSSLFAMAWEALSVRM